MPVDFGEPWTFIESDNDVGQIYCQGHKLDFSLDRATAERIIACVNFLAGVSTDDLELLAMLPFRETEAFVLGCVALASRKGC